MEIKKFFLLSLLLMCIAPSSAIVFPLVRFMVGGGLLFGASFAYEETKKEYEQAKNGMNECPPITRQDFDSGHEEELKQKCLCYAQKYKKVFLKAGLTLALGGTGARMMLKGVLK
jgi:hypothetical protein